MKDLTSVMRLANLNGARDVVVILRDAVSRNDGIESSCEINWLINARCGEGFASAQDGRRTVQVEDWCHSTDRSRCSAPRLAGSIVEDPSAIFWR
jgi:hypothetical protein